jgi:pPIWI_RE module N-terminal domain/RNaseH domain of pPIWI_RE/MID domain of pPIWI_RE
MRYDSIQPAAFVAVAPLRLPLHMLAFPMAWRQPILDLYTAGWREGSRERAKQVPIRRLNALLRAAAPDLVSTAKRASLDEAIPWLYSTSQFPLPLLRTFINAWLHDLPTGEDGKALILPTINKLDPAALRWQHGTVDVLAHAISDGGTAIPERHLYALLPDVVAGRIAQHAVQHPYEHCGRTVGFRQIAVNPDADCAELMSWPPLEHVERRRGTVRSWYYSATIHVALRTVPFDPIPRVHVNTGIRRWLTSEVRPKGRNSVSVYLLSTSPLVADAPAPSKFAVAQLQWDPTSGDMTWRHGGPGGMLSLVHAIERLPEADLLGRKPEFWLFGHKGVTAAVVYHTTMRGPTHQVGAGLMPAERSRLTTWIAEALAPTFQLAPPLSRITGVTKPARTLQPLPSIPKSKAGLTEAEQAALQARQEHARHEKGRISAANGRERRARLAATVPDRRMTTFLLFQEPRAGMRDRLLNTLERLLDLPPRETANDNHWTWHVDDFTLTVHARPLGALGAPLGAATRPRKGAEHDAAVAERRSDVAAAMKALSGQAGDTAQLVLIELDRLKEFNVRTTDPKFAIRMGCADANMVSQFIRPDDNDADGNDHRAEAAWQDAFRQLGMRFIPQSPDVPVPDGLNQLAFWIVKRRDDDTNTHPLFVPIAILIRPKQAHIMGKAEGMSGWMPYPELLKHLAGYSYRSTPSTEDEQKARLAAFVRTTLHAFRGTPTLIVTHAHNLRYRLPTVQNAHLAPQRVQFGDQPAQRLAFHGKQLRLVRVSGNDRMETPQAWGFHGEKAGIGAGLWQEQDTTAEVERVFYSTVEKPPSHTGVSVELAKLTPHYTENKKRSDTAPSDTPTTTRDHYDPSTTAWNPELLQFIVAATADGDDPATWAAFLHHQRFCFDDYRSALGLPLILHLAELANQYAIPSDDPDDEAQTDDGVSDEDELSEEA